MANESTGHDRRARTLVLGAGPLGLLMATTLASRGYRTTLFGRDPVLLDQINARGARVVGDLPVGQTTLEATERLAEPTEPFDLIIVATGPAHAVSAARAVANWLATDGVLLCLAAGLHDASIARIVGPNRYLGAVATFSAALLEPGVVERCGEGGLLVGAVHDPGAAGWVLDSDAGPRPSETGGVDGEDAEDEAGAQEDTEDEAGAHEDTDDEAGAHEDTDDEAGAHEGAEDEVGTHEGAEVGRLRDERAEADRDTDAVAGAAPSDDALPAHQVGAKRVGAGDDAAGLTSDARTLTEGARHPLLWVLHALEALAPVTMTTNLLGARWMELAVCCAFSPLAAISGLPARELADHGTARTLFLEIVREVAGLGAELGVALERLPSMPPLAARAEGDPDVAATAADEGARALHERVHNFAGRRARTRGSLAEHVLRGREAPTQPLRAFTLERAEPLGLALPLLRDSLDLVDRAAQGRLPVSVEALRALHLHHAARRPA